MTRRTRDCQSLLMFGTYRDGSNDQRRWAASRRFGVTHGSSGFGSTVSGETTSTSKNASQRHQVPQRQQVQSSVVQNPAVYFEIPVEDLARAKQFYEHVFGFDFEEETIHGNTMAHLPWHQEGSGISGSLAYGETYVPSLHGTLIYLAAPDISITLQRAVEAGGTVLFPKTEAQAGTWVAEIQDSEGNRIGLIERTPHV